MHAPHNTVSMRAPHGRAETHPHWLKSAQEHMLKAPQNSSRLRVHRVPLQLRNSSRTPAPRTHLWLSLQQQVACVGCRDFTDVKARVQGLANAVQHCEGPHHKGEGGGEAERLVVGSQQQVLQADRHRAQHNTM